MQEGKDIVYVHFSEAMSGTFNAMRLAWKMLSEKYPERKLYTIDTKGITICSYAIAREIGDLAKNGASVQEILYKKVRRSCWQQGIPSGPPQANSSPSGQAVQGVILSSMGKGQTLPLWCSMPSRRQKPVVPIS